MTKSHLVEWPKLQVLIWQHNLHSIHASQYNRLLVQFLWCYMMVHLHRGNLVEIIKKNGEHIQRVLWSIWMLLDHRARKKLIKSEKAQVVHFYFFFVCLRAILHAWFLFICVSKIIVSVSFETQSKAHHLLHTDEVLTSF